LALEARRTHRVTVAEIVGLTLPDSVKRQLEVEQPGITVVLRTLMLFLVVLAAVLLGMVVTTQHMVQVHQVKATEVAV